MSGLAWLRDRTAVWLLGLLLAGFLVVIGALYGAYELGERAGRPLGREDVLRMDDVLARLPAIEAMADSALHFLPRPSGASPLPAAGRRRAP